MPSPRRQLRADGFAGLPPSERWLVVHTAVLLVVSSWAAGGSYPWGPPLILGLVTLGLPLVALRCRETGRCRPTPFFAAAAWIVFCGIAVLNPSHAFHPGVGWLPSPRWLSWLPTTADVTHTLVGSLPWTAALVEGALLITVLRSAFTARAILVIAALNTFALAATGAFFRFSGETHMLGFIETPEPSYFFATFFYKNHWAVYGALGATAGFSIVLKNWRAAIEGAPHERGIALLFGATSLLTLVTLPLPGSRSGAALAIAIMATVIPLLLVVARRRPDRRADALPRRWLLVSIGVGSAAILGFGWLAYAPRATADLARTEQQLAAAKLGAVDLRLLLSRDTWKMAQARPWFGWGPGCFEVAFPHFQGNYLRDSDGRPQAWIRDAHDDWLQLLAECGFVGGAIIVIPSLMLGGRTLREGTARERWLLAMLALIAIYAVADFPFQNPSILLLWTILLAVSATMRRPEVIAK